MEYRIVHKDAFRIIGFRKRISLQFDGENPQIDELMERLTPSVRLELEALGTEEPHGILSISTAFEDRVREASLISMSGWPLPLIAPPLASIFSMSLPMTGPSSARLEGIRRRCSRPGQISMPYGCLNQGMILQKGRRCSATSMRIPLFPCFGARSGFPYAGSAMSHDSFSS